MYPEVNPVVNMPFSEVNPFPYMWDDSARVQAPLVDTSELVQGTTAKTLPQNHVFLVQSTDTGFSPLNYVLHHGTTNETIVANRRELLDEISAVWDEPRLAELWAQCSELGRLHSWLTALVRDPLQGSNDLATPISRIELYARDTAKLLDSKDPTKGFVPDDHRVWQLPSVAAVTNRAANIFKTTHGETFPHLGNVADIILQKTDTAVLGTLDPSEYIRTRGYELSETQQHALNSMRTLATEVQDVESLAELAHSTPLTNSTTSTSDPPAL